MVYERAVLSCPVPGTCPEVDLSTSRTPPLLALLASRHLRDRTRIALRFGTASRIIGPVTYVNDWQELGTVAAHHPGSPALVDTFPSANGGPRTDQPDSCRNGWLSRTPIICYGRIGVRRERKLSSGGITFAASLRPGVDDDPGAIDAAILRSIDAQRVRRLRLRIDRTAHPDTAEIVGCALDLSTGNCTVPDVARRIRRTARTLQRRCSLLGIPSPKKLLSLARIFTVQRLGEWSGQPYGAVAVALGFSDRSNYRRLVRGVFGRTPTEMARCGGHQYVAQTILTSVG